MKRLLTSLVVLLAIVGLAPAQAEAARYWCTDVTLQSGEPNASFEIHLFCTYVGTDVSGGTAKREVTALILYSPTADTAAIIRTKCTDAVLVGATQVPNSSSGLGVTVTRTGGFLPSFQTGQ